METVNDRRKFVKGLGLFSAFIGGLGAHSLANTGTSVAVRDNVDPVVPQSVDYSLAPPAGAPNIQLTGAYGDANVPMDFNPKGTGSIHYFNPQNTITNKVHMAVGRDDRLWIKVNDEWRRVAVES
jgi:hypothetical protein